MKFFGLHMDSRYVGDPYFGIRATKLTFITAAGLLPFSWLVILGVVFIYSYSRFGRITQNK